MKHKLFDSYELAGSLTAGEWRRFVRSVREDRSKQAIELGQMLMVLGKYHPSLQVADETLFAATFPGQAYNNGRLRVLRTYFKHRLEAFIVLEELSRSQRLKDRLLIAALKRRDLPEMALKVLLEAKGDVADPVMDLEAMEHSLELDEGNLDLMVRLRHRFLPINWGAVMHQVEQIGLVKRLRLLSAMISARAIRSSDLDWAHESIDDCLNAAAAMGTQLAPLGSIYFHLVSLLVGKNEVKHFESLKDILSRYGSDMPALERSNVFGLLVNHLLLQDQQGMPGSLSQAFATYQEMDRQGIIFGLGTFSVAVTRNIAAIGARLGEIIWTSQFLERAHAAIPVPDNHQVYHYGIAYLNFVQGNYAGAKRHLGKLEFADPFYKMAHDILLLRIAFEVNDIDSFTTMHAVFKRHLYRKAVTAVHYRKGIQNFLKVIIPLYDLRWNPQTKVSLVEIRKKVTVSQPISHLDWIEAKLQELEAQHPEAH
jgi:tetratricopeptide (TPR) repeat protein